MLITVKSMKSNTKKSFEANATTWGELKQQVVAQGFEVSGLKAILKNTGAVLELDSAVIPQEDLSLYLMVQNVKAGSVLGDAIREIGEKFKKSLDDLAERAEVAEENGDDYIEETEEDEDDFDGGEELSDEDFEEFESLR